MREPNVSSKLFHVIVINELRQHAMILVTHWYSADLGPLFLIPVWYILM